MANFPILNLCARIVGHKEQYLKLNMLCKDFAEWDELLHQAEKEGMTPLLNKHLTSSNSQIPVSTRRSLTILTKQHEHRAQMRLKILQESLDLLNHERLTPILLKGAALCYTLYPDPALRPMRDIDILLPRSEVAHAQGVLKKRGFTQSKSPIPPNHYHLPPLLITVGDVRICIELHRALYPDCPPYYPAVDFDHLLAKAKSFRVGTTEALTFCDEEMLHYLYQHAFRAPLTYETYKLINAADIIGFTEKNRTTIDWDKIRVEFPLLYNALPLMHHISPWNVGKSSEYFARPKPRKKLSAAPFTGWPQKRLKEQKANGKKLHQILVDTFLPPSWWLQVFYGVSTRRGLLWCLLVKHPCHIFWWVRLYSSLKKFNPNTSGISNGDRTNLE